MGRCLIVANRTLGGLKLLDEVAQRVESGAVAFHVLVPVDPDLPPGEREPELAAGRARMEAEVERLVGLGAEVSAETVEADPFDAVRVALVRERFDEILLCTLPSGLSRWLRRDLVDRVRGLTDVPVVHLTAPAGLPPRMRAAAVRLTVYVGERDRYGSRRLHTEIVHRARAAGLAGVTVVRGIEGFGTSQVVHGARRLVFSENLPVMVVVIDAAERIDAFLPVLDELVAEGLIVREDVDVVKYAGRPAD